MVVVVSIFNFLNPLLSVLNSILNLLLWSAEARRHKYTFLSLSISLSDIFLFIYEVARVVSIGSS